MGAHNLDSKKARLCQLKKLGFDVCPHYFRKGDSYALKKLEKDIGDLRIFADKGHLPIDGIVVSYDSIGYSAGCGHTGHHNKDGIAYKFEDESYETVLRKIEWTPTRFGEVAPVAIFDPVEIDGTVTRASLHNLTFIKDLELVPGCRVLVSKRNMIIPHIEDNLDRGHYKNTVPPRCPCCGSGTRIYRRKGGGGRMIETVYCDNPQCRSQVVHRFGHFVSKKAMDIEGLSMSTLAKFLDKGYLKTFRDIYHLDRYRDRIIAMEGFGEKSYKRLWDAIEKSRRATFSRYLAAMDIPMVGTAKSRVLEHVFKGSLDDFEHAALGGYDFAGLEDFGSILDRNIHAWFADSENLRLWKGLQEEMRFEKRKEGDIMKDNVFSGCTIVATGKLEHFTSNGINEKILEIGAKPGSSVTGRTNYVICGAKPGSKLAKAQALGIPVLTEEQFLKMIA